MMSRGMAIARTPLWLGRQTFMLSTASSAAAKSEPVKSGTPKEVAKSTWYQLDGFSKFSSRSDVESFLHGVDYEKLETLLDSEMLLTGKWVFKLKEEESSLSKFEEWRMTSFPHIESKRIQVNRFDLKDSFFHSGRKTSSQFKIDNRCIMIKSDAFLLEGDSISPDAMYRYFENYKLRHPKPFRRVYDKIVVCFESPMEAQRAVLEKSYTPIYGWSTIMFWYNI
jgi:hypothetical protein